MTLLGAIVLDVLGLLLLLWLLNLVRLGRLYVGYALVLVLCIGGSLVAASIPAVRAAAGGWLHKLFPGAELVIVAFGALLLILVYVLTQITLIANRLATLVQELALRDAAVAPGEPQAARKHGDDHAPAAPAE
jgi:hypothetical protein